MIRGLGNARGISAHGLFCPGGGLARQSCRVNLGKLNMNYTKPIASIISFSCLAGLAISSPLDALPVFPQVETRTTSSPIPPRGADFRLKSGKSSFRYVACNLQRTYNGQTEYSCVLWTDQKGWGKSVKWIPRYQLVSLSGPLPAEGEARPIKGGN